MTSDSSVLTNWFLLVQNQVHALIYLPRSQEQINMETEDLINLPASSNSGNGSDNNDLNNSTSEPTEAESIPSNSKVKDDKLNEEIKVINGDDEKEDNHTSLTSDKDKDLVDSTTTLQVTVEVTEGIAVDEKIKCLSPTEHVENGDLTSQDKNQNPLGNHKRAGSPISSTLKDGSCILLFTSYYVAIL